MKHTFRAVATLLTLAALSFSCKREEAPPKHNAFFKFRKNYTDWVAARCFAEYVQSEKRFHIGGLSDKEPNEGFYFKFSPPQGSDVSRTNDFSVTYTLVVQMDMIFDQYNLDGPNDGSWLEVTRYDTVNRIIEGKFHAILRRDTHYVSNEKMYLEDGEFSLQYAIVE